jgi:small subunit ribosomal protein S8
MSMSDPIADMLTRIRNASRARHPSCEMPASRMKRAIAEVLRDEGYIDSFEERGEGVHKVLRVYLRYAPGGRGRDPVLLGIKRISKPGLRVYARASQIPRVFGGLGTAILSTPQGVMSGKRAQSVKVGGEVLAHVW